MNNLRSVQRDPDHPEAQLHTPGDVQAPPFAQAGVQMAGEGEDKNVDIILVALFLIFT